jgi:hypothetical protein
MGRKNVPFQEEISEICSKMYNGFHVKYRYYYYYYCRILMKLELFRQIFEKKTLKYQTSCKSVQWVPTDGRTDGRTISHD